ncbi:zinc-dependent alcohol dehydrogenase [Chromobacterium vaccinii]|uniref:zinc-dependent alcohol dehydrogenase n=1 Tax=Chromobacterium vaccinii TaxID=1108595 RepID=UPI0006974F10|nr:FAD-dependent oxidoreductase [Chromobacterium vaccinii]
MNTMRAVVWEGPQRLRLATLPRPALLEPDDALLRVTHASTCGTDLHIYRGAVPGFEPGTVIGHEFVGEVAAVGPAVKLLRPGLRAACADFIACGACAQCAAGRHAQCGERRLFGFSGLQPRLDGGLAEYVRVPRADVALSPLADGADPRFGLLSGDVMPTALGALQRLALAPGERLAVVGAGPVGVLTAWLAARRGVDVLLLEANPARAARALSGGLAVAEIAAGQPLSDAGPGLAGVFDAAVDAVGGERGLKTALAALRPRGRLVGAGSQAGRFELDWGALMQREISLQFVIGDPIGLRGEVEAAMADCAPALELMFSDRLRLDEVPDYFAALCRRERFKALVEVAGEAA